MRFVSRLWKTELLVLAALIDAALLMGVCMAWDGWRHPGNLFGAGGGFMLGVVATMCFGTLPALLLGAPSYAWLAHQGRARWWNVVLLGALMGSAVFVVEPALAWLAMGMGAFVALCTHWAAGKVLRV